MLRNDGRTTNLSCEGSLVVQPAHSAMIDNRISTIDRFMFGLFVYPHLDMVMVKERVVLKAYFIRTALRKP